MSLSALLLGSSTAKDADLDQIFNSSVSAPVQGQDENQRLIPETDKNSIKNKEKKRKNPGAGAERVRRKSELADGDAHSGATGVINNSQNRLEKSKSRRSEDDDATRPKKKHKSSPTVPTTTEFLPGAIDIKKRSTESPSKTLSNSSVTGKTAKSKTKTKQEPTTNEHPQATPTTHEKAADESDEDSDVDPSQIVHESLLRGSQKSRSTKYRPEGETDEQRNARTLFVGNVPAAAVKEKSVAKSLKRHILSFLPTTSDIKIESIRFRSVAFRTPMSKLASDTPTKGKGKERQHELDRASSWKASHLDSAADENKKDEKKFLTPAQKKKIAFIKGEVHDEADSVNAYIVLAHPPPLSSTSDLAEKSEDVYEIAGTLAKATDGSLFMEHLLRVSVAQTGSGMGTDGDPKKSIFVGSLDFAAKEDDLRVYFETLLKSELGQEGAEEQEEREAEEGFVERVRIVRDKDTQLGKGFGYVQFKDKKYVDEVLAMDASKLKFAKRKIRVQRCKVLPSVSYQITPSPTKTGPLPIPALSASTPVQIPKGDPMLGTKLANLSKEERKMAKASNADRVARRLAKKKARNALQAPNNVERKRERKPTGVKKDLGGKKEGKSKGRVRSDRSLARRNLKK